MDPRVLLVDADQCALEAHRAGLRAQGWTADSTCTVSDAVDRVRKDGADVVVLGPNLSEAPDSALAQLRGEEAPDRPAVIVVLPRGAVGLRTRALAAGAALILDAPIDPTALVAATRAMLRYRAAADDLTLARRALENVRREHRLMVDALVHDLKNPLSVILANVDWAMDQVADTDQDLLDGLVDAREGAERVQATLEDLLMVVKLERSELPLKRESIRVSELVNAVLRGRVKEAEIRNVSLVNDVADDLEYTGDRGVLKRVLDGMVESSIRYAPTAGRVELSARRDSGLQIAVTNTPSMHPSMTKIRVGDGALPSGDPEGQLSMALRLYFCRKAVEAVHGCMELLDSPEASRSLVIRLPMVG